MRLYETHEAAKILGLPEARIHSCVRAGYLGPGRGGELKLSFQDLLVLEASRGLLDSGVSARRIARLLGSLRAQLAGVHDPARLTVYAEGDRVVVADGDARWETDSGQVLLDLGAPAGARAGRGVAKRLRALAKAEAGAPAATRAAVIIDVTELAARAAERSRGSRARSAPADAATATGSPADERTAEEWFELACELEEEDEDEAIAAYERAIALEPAMADAHLNLGLLRQERGEHARAEAHYLEAARHAPADATPWFNLGVLHEDQDDFDRAIGAYEQAIARDRECADAHYNLGLLLERRGRKAQALTHLMKARRLYGPVRGS